MGGKRWWQISLWGKNCILCFGHINFEVLVQTTRVLRRQVYIQIWATEERSHLGIYWELLEEEAMAPHSSPLAWKIPWMEEPGRLQSMGLQRVGHDWATSLSLLCIGEGNGNPLQCSCLDNPRDGAAQSQTRLKWLSSSRELLEYAV